MSTRIVICDDHPLFRGGLAAALGDEDDLAIVDEVGSLAELRRALDQHDPDLVLLDVDLPDGSGADVVTEVAANATVVMISAFDDVALVRRAVQDGATGYIRKDAEPSEVLRLVHRAADGRAALSGDMAMRIAESLRRDNGAGSVDDRLALLSPRQREVLALVADGKRNREIATALNLSEGTVKNHVSRILEIVGVSDRTKLAVLLARQHVR
jgi:DNA-binding NarL/FixJ family response regulator